jgi:hypothetical protein
MAELETLVVLETRRRNAEAIRQVGQRALEKARRAGVPPTTPTAPRTGTISSENIRTAVASV